MSSLYAVDLAPVAYPAGLPRSVASIVVILSICPAPSGGTPLGRTHDVLGEPPRLTSLPSSMGRSVPAAVSSRVDLIYTRFKTPGRKFSRVAMGNTSSSTPMLHLSSFLGSVR